jgi:hypothetical protein
MNFTITLIKHIANEISEKILKNLKFKWLDAVTNFTDINIG